MSEVHCSTCGKEMQAYPFKSAKTCIKCTLQENFEHVPAMGRCKLGGS